MELNIRNVSTDDRVAKVSVGGRLDSMTYQKLELALMPVINSSVQTVILDLGELSFISSAGIRVLMTATNELAKRNGNLLLTNLQPQIAKVLDIIKALPGIGVFQSVQEMDNYLAAMQKKVLEEN
jgi:anti-anti-sigma factor